MARVPTLALEGVTKAFEGQRALDNFDIELRAGEIHGLVGQNGSGKSTLIKLLAGYHQPTHVRKAELHGAQFDLGSMTEARSSELSFIHQDLGLIGGLDATDNLALGQSYAGRWWLSDRTERAAARKLCENYGLSIDAGAPVAQLSPAEQTVLAIVRGLRSGIENRMVLVLDEPTAALPSHEVHRLFMALREIRERGGTVLYVTHRLAEVFELADRVTVVRDGKRVATHETADLDHDRLLELILGRPIDAPSSPTPAASSDVVLTVDGLRGGRVRDVSLELRQGETLGVTGLVGSGFDEILRLIFDPSLRRAGTITMNGEPLTASSITATIKQGIGLVPADRQRLGGIGPWSVRENVTLPALRPTRLGRWLKVRTERSDVAGWLRRLRVSPAEPEQPFSALSGGNQQKVVLARWLRSDAEVYLLEEPTNGVDVGAKQTVHAAIAEAIAAGASVLMASSDADELCMVCDRVLVMRGGVIRSVLDGEALTEERLLTETTRDDDGGGG